MTKEIPMEICMNDPKIVFVSNKTIQDIITRLQHIEKYFKDKYPELTCIRADKYESWEECSDITLRAYRLETQEEVEARLELERLRAEELERQKISMSFKKTKL